MYDKNGDGWINVQELTRVMQMLGNNPTAKYMKEVMKEADKDGKRGVALLLQELTIVTVFQCLLVAFVVRKDLASQRLASYLLLIGERRTSL